MADKKLNAEITFQPTDLKAKCGLRDISLIGGPRQVADLDDFSEIFELTKMDGIPLIGSAGA